LSDKSLYPHENELRKDDEEIFKKEETEETEEETEEDNEQDKIYNIDYESEKTPKSIRDIFKNVRPREKTPKIKAFMEKLTMLKNKKQRKGLLVNDTKIEFLKIEISDLRENLDVIIETYLSKWQDFLYNNTDQLLMNINSFMQLTLEGIKKRPDSGQTDLLYDILRYIRDFKRVDKIVRCYKKNTKESIQTLKKFDFRKGEDPTKDESSLDK